MNKFSKIVMGLKALLGQKAPSSAVTDIQLDWDNHQISLEDGEWWISEVAATTPKDNTLLGKVMFVCNDDPFQTCTVCNNDKLVAQSEVANPFVCGWCQDETRYHLGLMKAEKAAMVQADAMLLKELTLDRLSDAEDYPEAEVEELKECPCSDEGCYRCNPL